MNMARLKSIARGRGPALLGAAAAAVVFLWTAARNLEYPAVHWEEAMSASAAVELLEGAPLSEHFVAVEIGGKRWPVLMSPRGIGAIEAYVMLPVFGLFGVSPAALRMTETLLTLLAGLLFFWAARLMFDRATAIVAGLWITFDAAFLIYGSRNGFEGVVLVQWILLAAALVLFWTGVKRRSAWGPLAAAFVLGLGVFAKLRFGGLALGAALGALWLARAGEERVFLKSVLPKALLLFAAGAAPVFLWNAVTDTNTFFHLKLLAGADAQPFVERLLIRLYQLGRYLKGDVPPVFEFKPPLWAVLAKVLPLAFGIVSLLPGFVPPGEKGRRQIFLAIAAAVYLLFAACVLSWPSWNGVLPALPLVLMIGAAALTSLAPPKGVWLAAALVFAADARIGADFHARAELERKTPVARELAEYLTVRGHARPLNVNDHDFGPEIQILSRGRVVPAQALFFKSDERASWFKDYVGRPGQVFVATFGRPLSDEDAWEDFSREVEKRKKRLVVERELDGRRIVVFTLR